MTLPKRPQGFNAKRASKLTGCTLHQLRYWDEIALVRPSVQAPEGHQGIERIYCLKDLIVLRAIRKLKDAGLPLQRIGKVMRYLRKHAGLDQVIWARSLAGPTSVAAGADATLAAVLAEGELAFCNVLADAADKVEHLVHGQELVQVVRKLRASWPEMS